MATKVKLRTKPISGNRQSLYLDFYPPIPNPKTGEPTRREFLNLFLINEIEHETLSYLDRNGKAQKKIVPVLDKKGHPKKLKLKFTEKQHNKEVSPRPTPFKKINKKALCVNFLPILRQ